jgi:hypothetical protein
MSTAMHPAAPHHLPAFITPPGETDAFLIGSAIFLVVMIIGAGSLYFRLHALPEHLAHRNASKLQFEVVAVLALIALFTHNTAFWVAALLLALIPIPNFHGPLAGMADSLARIAGWRKQSVETAPLAYDPDIAAVTGPQAAGAPRQDQPRPLETAEASPRPAIAPAPEHVHPAPALERA